MKTVKKGALLLSLLLFSFVVVAQESMIKKAEEAYSSGDYNGAITLYEELIKEYGESFVIYYNLGNSYFKSGQMAPALLNYERAQLLNPKDKDVRFNIQMAKLRIPDKIEPLGTLFFVRWFLAVQNLFDLNSWGIIGITFFVLFIFSLFVFFFSKWRRMRQISFYGGIVCLFVVIMANIFASNQKSALLDRKGAIVFAPTVTIKSSPDASGTDLFVLHEGSKVKIRNSVGQWYEIELEDGNVGWIPQADIERI